jgi:hypothetical protein
VSGERQAYVHTADVSLDGDEGAVGAAVTVELCGHWEHPPPCRVPHRTDVAPGPDAAAVRVIFACEPAQEAAVRSGVERALQAGELPVPAPEGSGVTRWQVLRSGPGEVLDADRAVAARFVAAPE